MMMIIFWDKDGVPLTKCLPTRTTITQADKKVKKRV